MAIEVKLDKETLIKHRFWFLLPVIAICVLVGWICVLGVRGEAEENQKAAETVHRYLKGVLVDQGLRNQAWVAEEAKKKLESQGQKGEIWLQNYDAQNQIKREGEPTPAAPGQPPAPPKIASQGEPLLTWPPETIQEWNKNNQGRAPLQVRDFGEYLGIIPADYKEHYRMQFDKIVELLPWLDETRDDGAGAGAIRVLNGSGGRHRDRALTLLNITDLKANNRDVESLEAWTLQEDLAIRRELLRSLSGIIDNYSLMHNEWRRIPPPDPKAAAPAAPAAPGAAPTASAPASASAPEPGMVVDKASFYNFVWPTLAPSASGGGAEAAKPSIAAPPTCQPWQGWQVDLEMAVDEKRRLLRGSASNYSPTLKIPPAELLVWFIDAQSGAEMQKPVVIDDAGGLPAAAPGDGLLSVPAAKKLRTIEAPPGAVRISRLERRLKGDWADAAVVFNQNWLLEVKLASQPGNSVTQVVCTLTNRGARRLPVPYFRMEWSENPVRRPEGKEERPKEQRIRFPVDALDAGARKEHTFEIRLPQPPVRIISLREQMDWRTTPIKRIDVIAIGAAAHEHADRTKTTPLKGYDFASKDYRPPATPAGSVPPPPPVGGAAAPASEGPAKSTNHGIDLKRYIEVSKEVRRVPVGVVLVVNATNVNDVLTSLSNSRLSFQVTQAAFNRIPSLGPPAAMAAEGSGGSGGSGSGAGAGSGVQTSAGGGGAGPPAMGLPQNRGGFGGGASSGAGGGTPSGDAPKASMPVGVVDDSSVVVLQIYGMVTLYESPEAEARIAAEKAKAAAANQPR